MKGNIYCNQQLSTFFPRLFFRNIPRIFMLHRFSDVSSSGKTSLSDLSDFLSKLASHFELTTISGIFLRLNSGEKLSKPLAAITVDDGYADFYDVALPVLVELKIPATVYVTAGFIDKQCWLWWDGLRYLIAHHPEGSLKLPVCGDDIILMINDNQSRRTAWSRIADKLVRLNAERSNVMAQLERSAGIILPTHPTDDYKAMSWLQLAECQAAGMEIGCHTMTHAYLPSLNEPGLQYEIHDAKAIIEQRLSVPVTSFAYPNGMQDDVNESVIHAVRDAGFQSALMAYPRRFKLDEPYTIGRWSAIPGESQLEHIISGMSYLKVLVQENSRRIIGKKDIADSNRDH